MPTHQPDIAEILSTAVEFDSSLARDAYLEQACGGDAALQARVAELVRMHFLAGDFLESPATDLVDSLTGQAPAVRVGAKIGPYKLLQQIGEGGMGVVYMAQQDHPVERRVALKVIKAGMDTRQVIARFEAERQALALMDHPNIARVLDAGMTPSGRPYFVMELIDGIPITRYCDEQHLSPIERLQLLLPVCYAVQHAHQKGIIHRDLKPSNILVAQYDNLAVPKVIDFGVAKAISQPLTDLTLFTEFGQVMGTFEYMSPEQAGRNQLDIDTRTDVYSLGVILYELLTGSTPFDAMRFQQAAFDEILRIIGDEEPQRPSMKLSGSRKLASVAANRRLDPARLSRFVAGDLDWIVMRSLEKDRGQRYATVGSLANDLQRFLNNEPVEAGPPTVLYRFRKFACRNTGLLLSAALITLLLILGTAISSALAIRAMQAERRAEELATLATREASLSAAARDSAELQRSIAVQRELSASRSRYSANLMLARDAAERGDSTTALDRLKSEVPASGHFDVRGFGWYFLRGQFDRELAVLQDHKSTINGLAFSPDGSLLATAADDHRVQIWEVAARAPLRTLIGHDNMVNAVAFSPDGTLLASVSDDETIRLWDCATGAPVAVLRGHQGNVRGVAFSPDGTMLATAGADAVIRLWTVADRQLIAELKGHMREINELAFSPDGLRLASCADDRTARVWNVEAREEVLLLAGHSDHVRTVQFSPDGTRLATGGREGVIRVWDGETGEKTAELNGHTLGVSGLAFARDGDLIASVSDDRLVRFWDLRSGKFLCSRVGHSARIYTAQFAPDGRSIATAGADGTVRFWDVADLGERILLGHESQVHSVTFSPDGKRLASGGWDNKLRLWDRETGTLLATLEGCGMGLKSAEFQPTGELLAAADGLGVICFWNATTGELKRQLPAHRSAVSEICFSADGRRLASAGADQTVAVWDVEDGTLVARFDGHTAPVETVAFLACDRQVISGGRDSTVCLWDIETGRSVGVIDGDGGIVTTVSTSPDGRWFAVGGADGAVRLYNAKTRLLQTVLNGHTMQIESVVFSRDGGFLASGGNDRTVRLWDLQTGLNLATFTGHTGHVNSIALTTDAHWLASAGADSTVRIWEIHTTPSWATRARLRREEAPHGQR